jgi:hypothetical protein
MVKRDQSQQPQNLGVALLIAIAAILLAIFSFVAVQLAG